MLLLRYVILNIELIIHFNGQCLAGSARQSAAAVDSRGKTSLFFHRCPQTARDRRAAVDNRRAFAIHGESPLSYRPRRFTSKGLSVYQREFCHEWL